MTLLDRASALLGAPLELVAELGGSSRTEVLRVLRGSEPLIVKGYVAEGHETWPRESCGLAAAEGSGSPALVAVGDDLVVMEDLGVGPSVADALLGADQAAAAEAVVGWARAIGSLHVLTLERGTSFTAALADRATQLPAHAVPAAYERSAQRFAELATRLGLTVPAGALDELVDLPLALGPEIALTPGDACPDNNVIVDGEVRLIDFEWAEVRHVAWDLAYLRVPWPTCWCAWDLPSAVADAAFAGYVDLVGPALPYVGSPQFLHDIDRAALGWCLRSSALYTGWALDADEPHEDTPSRRAMVLQRLEAVAEMPCPAALSQWAGLLHARLLDEWGPLTIDLAPAFRVRT